jgi:hypothetical protein
MKKILKWGVLAVVLLIAIAIAIVYWRLNSIVKYVIETQGTKQTNLATQLDGASVGLFGGEVELDDLKIANPPGYSTPHLLTLDELDVKAPIKQLRGNPKRISAITFDKPKLVIERSSDGVFNFKKAIEQMPKSSTPPTGPQQPAPQPTPQEPAPAPADEMKLIIDELTIKDAVVLIRPGINFPGVAQEYTVPIPTVVMKNIGNADGTQNGAAMRDVAQQVITVMAANASNSGMLPKELQNLLNMDLNSVMAELGNRLGAEAQKRIAAAVPGELGQQLSKVIADPNALMKDPSKAADVLKENLGKTLGEKGLPTSNPADLLKDPGKAAEGLQGLLGGRKDKEKRKPADAPSDSK